ncbi:MAG: glutathione S-transferase family protein [Paracoccaceae bacterium]
MPDITVYTFSPDWGLPTTGPFALKLLAWLGLHGIPHRTVVENNTRKAPAGKIPWAVIDGEPVADSDRIIARLSHLAPPDPEQPAPDRAAAHAFKTAFEERVHQVLEYELFLHPAGAAYMDGFIRRHAPFPLGGLVSHMMRRHFGKQLHARGLTRHTPEEIAAMGRAEIAALADYIAARPYLGGEAPSRADLAVFGQVMPLLAWPMRTPVADTAKATPILRDWAGRIHTAAFGVSPDP